MQDESVTEDYEEEKDLAVALPGARTTLAQLRRFTGVTIYGFLLNPDPKHPLAQVMRERWSELHYLSGGKVMLVATEVPAQWTKSLEEYWKEKLGEDFEPTWQEWRKSPDAGIAFQYMDLFDPPLDQSQLPCLVLFTNPEKPQAVVRSIPAWDGGSLYQLLRNLLGNIRQCAELPDETKRMECLEKSLASTGSLILSNLEYAKDKVSDYIGRHPVQVVTTTISFVLALATGNVLALSPNAVTILKAIKEAVSSKG